MRNQTIINSQRKNLLFLTIFFTLSRIFFSLLGLRFDSSSLSWFYQYIDPLLLKTRFFESLFYLHSQPPGYNFFLGIILQACGDFAPAVFQLIYYLLGLLMVVTIYIILLKLNFAPLPALILSIVYSILPPVLLYENWLFYTYPVTFLITITIILLFRWRESKKWWYLFSFFLVCMFIVLIRTLFHPIWLLCVILIMVIRHKKQWRLIFLAALPALLIVLGLFCKNYIIFKQYGFTSWTGMNLSKMTLSAPFYKLKPMVESDEISSLLLIMPFQKPEVYTQFSDFDPNTGIPILDTRYKSTGAINFNNLGYISLSQQYQANALKLMRRHPRYYGLSVAKAFYAYLRPSSDSVIFRGSNRQKLRGFTDFYQNYFVGDILKYIWSARFINRYGQDRIIHLNFLYIIFPIIFVWAFYCCKRGTNTLNLGKNASLTNTYMLFTMIWVSGIANLVEISENMRFRFLIMPILFIFSCILLKFLFKRVVNLTNKAFRI